MVSSSPEAHDTLVLVGRNCYSTHAKSTPEYAETGTLSDTAAHDAFKRCASSIYAASLICAPPRSNLDGARLA